MLDWIVVKVNGTTAYLLEFAVENNLLDLFARFRISTHFPLECPFASFDQIILQCSKFASLIFYSTFGDFWLVFFQEILNFIDDFCKLSGNVDST